MFLHADIAFSHLRSRRRQTLVSLLGVVLGVGFFCAVSALMRGSELDIVKRLVDTSPHVTVRDEFRNARPQPAALAFPDGAVQIHSVKPQAEKRGIRQYKQKLESIDRIQGVQAAPLLVGTAIFSFAGRDVGVTLSGILPERMKGVSTLQENIIAGSLDAVDINPNGIIIGEGLARKLNLAMGETVTLIGAGGNVRAMKIVGMFRTGNLSYDESQTFAQLTRVQSLLGRPNTANTIVLRMTDAYRASEVASFIETSTGYKSVSWQESSRDLLNTLTIRNVIMYTVVSAILVVACFGIYNVISTVVIEKTRDIAILKSMGFHARDVRWIFVIEGAVIGVIGSALGVLFGLFLMRTMAQVEIRTPFASEPVFLPVYWGADQFLIAVGAAVGAAVFAAWLPARKGGRLQPVDVLRGAA